MRRKRRNKITGLDCIKKLILSLHYYFFIRIENVDSIYFSKTRKAVEYYHPKNHCLRSVLYSGRPQSTIKIVIMH